MNWKFWQQKPLIIPSGMNPLERAILDDIQTEPERWTIRLWKEGSVRADSRGIIIISTAPADPRKDVPTACAGPVNFGPNFARQWHRLVADRLAEYSREQTEIEQEKMMKVLNHLFLPD